MDNVISASARHPPGQLCSAPRLPPRGVRQTDTRPSPPPPPAPPIPAREPLHPARLLAVPSTRSGGTVHAGGEVTGTVGAPPLDRVVPLSRWPFAVQHVNKSSPGQGHSTSTVEVQNVMLIGPSSQQSALHTTAANEYVDAPSLQRNRPVTSRASQHLDGCSLPLTECQRHPTVPSVVVTQPPSIKLDAAVDLSSLSDGEKLTAAAAAQQSAAAAAAGRLPCRGTIVCSRCGRCRCCNCVAPRELPRRWIGDCECSVQRCVNVTSCVCCVEALFYHCVDGGSSDGCDVTSTADDPCACCERPRCCLRWTLIGALATTVLPCLWCYCPLQCAADGLTSCYNACVTERGCRCRGAGQEVSSSAGSTRGLLAESESSST